MAINLDHQRDRLSTSSETLTLNNTGSLILPTGTSLERPSSSINGQIRFNSTESRIEQYVNNAWAVVGITEISDLSDVTVSGSIQQGQTLVANSSGVFTNVPNDLVNLTDTALGPQADKQVLRYNNGFWRNTILELNDLSDVVIAGTIPQDKILKSNNSGQFVLVDAPFTPVDVVGATSTTDGTAGLVPQPVAGDQLKFLRGDGSWAIVTQGNTSGTTYDISVASGTTKLRLTGSDGVVDDVEFVGTGATTVTRTNSSKFTIDSTNTEYTAAAGVQLTGTVFSADPSSINHNVLSNYVANEHIDWSISQSGNTPSQIHADNYTDTQYVSSDFDHNQLTNYVAAQHINWTLANQGTIDSSNINFPQDVNTTYSQSVTTSSGDIFITLSGSDGSTDGIEIDASGATSVTRNSADKITISSTDTQYSAGTGIQLNGTVFSSDDSAIDHNALNNYVANQHIDWTVNQSNNIHAGNLPAIALTTIQVANSESAQLNLVAQEGDVVVRSDQKKTYMHNGGSAGTMADYTLLETPTDSVTSVDGQTGVVTLNHDSLAGFVQAEHVDWTQSNQGTIHSSNITFPSDANTTYTVSVPIGTTTIRLTGNDSSTDDIEFAATGATTLTRNTDSKITISSTDTQYTAGTGIQLNGTVFSSDDSAIDHNSLNNYVANQHIDWSVSQSGNTPSEIHADNYTDTQYVSGDFDHNQLTNYVANQHIDWSVSQSGNTPSEIHADNYTDTQYVSSDFDHNQLTNYVANQHIDWTSANAGTIDTSNYTSLLTVKEINDPVTNVSVSNVSELQFDVDGGFALTNLGNNKVKITLESTFKTWKIYDNPTDTTATDIVASGVDTISLKGGTGVNLAGVTTAGSKSLTFSIGQDVSTTSDVTFNDLTVDGNLTVNGTQTILNTETLDVEDKNIILGKVTSPTNDTGDGGGITLKAASDKTITWSKTTDRWTFNTGTEIQGIVHINSEQSSSPTAPANGSGGYFYTKADGKPYWISSDQAEIDLTQISGYDVSTTTPNSSDVLTWNGSTNEWEPQASSSITTLGSPTDTTYNDGAYYQAGSSYQNGTSVSGFDTSGSITDAIDAINETMKNIHNNTYVQGAYFTNTTTQGSASPANPLSVTFTIVNKGDATHVDWEFKNTSTNNTITVSDSTSTTSYTQDFTEVAGGPIDVTMTMKCSTGSTSNMTEGSYFTYKKTAAVTLFTPAPEIAWTTTNNDQIVDLGSGTASDREIEFDVTSSLYVTYWMIEFGDGSKYPSGADPAGDNTHVQSNWIEWASTKKHTYDYDANGSTVTQDTRWSPKVYGRSTGANGGAGTTNSLQKNNHIEGFISPTAAFTVQGATTGNNDEAGDVNANGDTNTQEGHPVKFTNTTANLGIWGDTTYTWNWGDGTSNTVVTGGGNTEGDVNQQIEHYFTLANDNVGETFDVTLTAENNRTSNNSNTTSATTITVNVDPRAGFSGAFVNQNTSASGNPNYVNPRIGYNFTKYSTSGGADSNGASNIVDFTNNSAGVTGTSPVYAWTFNNGLTSASANPPNQSFTTAGSYDIKLITQNANSYAGGTDDTEEKTNYITINANPSAPPGLTNLTIAVPSGSIVGSDALATSNISNNTSGSAPAGGTSVTRIVTNSLTTEKLSNFANEFPSNGTYVGVLTAHLNGGIATGTITFDGSNKIGTDGILEVTDERDSNARDSNTYPDNFYKEFKARAVLTGLSAGFNTIQLKHSGATVTLTTETQFVYDNMTSVPTVNSFGTISENTGSYRYMSGIKFYNSGSSLDITGLQIDNLTGETYKNTSTPLTISNNTGSAISSQDFSYVDMGLTTTPSKNLSPTLGAITLNINGSGTGTNGRIKASAVNVNGQSSDHNSTTNIMYWISSPTLDELSISNNISLGSAVSGATVGKRINYAWTGTDYDHPGYTAGSNDWYTTYVWDSQTDTLPNTNEAGCYTNLIQHTLEDFSTGHLPVGDNLSTGRSTSATQYFTFAFKRNSIAKFAIKLSGEVTSLYIAFPQYTTDSTSTLNGWLDCSTNFGGGGIPGAGTGGNGSNGVRRTGTSAQQGSFAVNTALTNAYANLDLGEANTGSMTYPTVLVRFGVANGKSVSAISLEDWST